MDLPDDPILLFGGIVLLFFAAELFNKGRALQRRYPEKKILVRSIPIDRNEPSLFIWVSLIFFLVGLGLLIVRKF